MKKLISLLLISLTVIACSKNKQNKEIDLKIDPDRIAKERERIINEKIEETLQENKIDICEVREQRPGFLKRLAKGFLGIFKKKDDFDVVFTKEISEAVLKDIMGSIYANLEFNPSEFWSLLSPSTAIRLNRLLVEKYIHADDETFKKVRDLAAFSYLFYFQLEQREKGYELFVEDQELGVERIKVAFDETALFSERVKLSFCDKLTLPASGFRTNTDYQKPSEITGRVVCTGGQNRVEIEQYLDETTRFTLSDNDEKQTFRVLMPTDNRVDEDASNVKISMKASQLGLDMNLDVERKTRPSGNGSAFAEYRKNTVRKLALEGEVRGIYFKMKKLSCREIKKIKYQQ